jgi:hypothetical protein
LSAVLTLTPCEVDMIRVEAPNREEAAMELVDSLKPVWFVPRQVLCRRWDAQLVDCELQKALLKLQYRCNFQPGPNGLFFRHEFG